MVFCKTQEHFENIFINVLSRDHLKRNRLDLSLIEVSTYFYSLNDQLCYIKVSNVSKCEKYLTWSYTVIGMHEWNAHVVQISLIILSPPLEDTHPN